MKFGAAIHTVFGPPFQPDKVAIGENFRRVFGAVATMLAIGVGTMSVGVTVAYIWGAEGLSTGSEIFLSTLAIGVAILLIFSGRAVWALKGAIKSHQQEVAQTVVRSASSSIGRYQPTVSSSVGTVMIVDSDKVSRTNLARVLQTTGYQVAVAESGSTALELLRGEKDRAGVLILDANAPYIEIVRTFGMLIAEHPTLPVILAVLGQSDRPMTKPLDEPEYADYANVLAAALAPQEQILQRVQEALARQIPKPQ